jgi:hypothetical protein
MEDEIRAAVGAHQDLGPGYDAAVAEGLVERIGAEIDKRIDTRLGPADRTPARTRRAAPFAPVVALGSLGLGVAATAVVTSHGGPAVGKVFEVIVIWVAIMCVAAVYLDKE